MKPLPLDIINASAPYEVYWHETSRTYRFKSDFGVVLAIGFDDDDIIENAESYIFSIINVNKIPSPRDLKMRDTVMLIIENFFNMNEAALLYICESGDGKQHMRSRLFEYWFSSYQMKDKFILCRQLLKQIKPKKLTATQTSEVNNEVIDNPSQTIVDSIEDLENLRNMQLRDIYNRCSHLDDLSIQIVDKYIKRYDDTIEGRRNCVL